MKYTVLALPLWKWEGALVVGGKPADFAKWAKSYQDSDINADPNAAGHAYVESGKLWLLWVESLKDLPTLAHEAFHVTCGVLEGRGLKHTSESEEAYTYTMEQILRDALATDCRWKKCR